MQSIITEDFPRVFASWLINQMYATKQPSLAILLQCLNMPVKTITLIVSITKLNMTFCAFRSMT